ncbi:venom protease-like [Arctopsyche grandis]|uniref:venom protease-like n=1 Tax=Arctopsyche grandis TaxID=121162 RepID=UPI00406D74EF
MYVKKKQLEPISAVLSGIFHFKGKHNNMKTVLIGLIGLVLFGTSPSQSSLDCEPPHDSITVQKTEQRSWNECIDIGRSVYPCENNGIQKKICGRTSADMHFGYVCTENNEFPHVVALGFDNKSKTKKIWPAGGTLISEQWVLTAATSVYFKSDVKYVRVHDLDLSVDPDPRYLYGVKTIVKHPSYVKTKLYNDIALLQLDRFVLYTTKVYPACLHVGNPIDDNKAIGVLWGKIHRHDNKKLIKATYQKGTLQMCSESLGEQSRMPEGIKNDIQIFYKRSEPFANEHWFDCGTPLQVFTEGVKCTYTVIGIGPVNSYGNAHNIYTKVSAYIPWIESIVWPHV